MAKRKSRAVQAESRDVSSLAIYAEAKPALGEAKGKPMAKKKTATHHGRRSLTNN